MFPLDRVPLYPNYVCSNCAARATDREGRTLAFGNVDIQVDTSQSIGIREKCMIVLASAIRICYIDGIVCYADEANFGGL
jgi:hypothetical protein